MRATGRFFLVFAFLFAVCGSAAETNRATSASEKLARLQQEHAAAKAAYNKAGSALPETPEGEKKGRALWKEFDKKQSDLFTEAVQLAKDNPKSETGFAALEWTLMDPRAYHLPAGPAGMELMAYEYPENPNIGKMLSILGYYFPWPDDPTHAAALSLLKSVAAKNTNRVARGHAFLALAWLAKRDFEAVSWDAPNAEELAVKMEHAFDTVLHDYGDCPNLRTIGVRPATKTLGEEAQSELVELRLLRIGKVAPDIEGEDLNGVRFKLSDYRGKVVLLVFWASWCGPCMADVPHENELFARFKDRPFTLVGVNGDARKTDATRAVTESKMAWRSFWNGKDGPGGAIAGAWNVRHWPQVYVLDEKGVIRLKDLRGKDLDAPLEKMVSAVERR